MYMYLHVHIYIYIHSNLALASEQCKGPWVRPVHVAGYWPPAGSRRQAVNEKEEFIAAGLNPLGRTDIVVSG